MNTKWNFLIVLALLAAMFGGSASVARAQGVISDVSPAEGTVGTPITSDQRMVLPTSAPSNPMAAIGPG